MLGLLLRRVAVRLVVRRALHPVVARVVQSNSRACSTSASGSFTSIGGMPFNVAALLVHPFRKPRQPRGAAAFRRPPGRSPRAGCADPRQSAAPWLSSVRHSSVSGCGGSRCNARAGRSGQPPAVRDGTPRETRPAMCCLASSAEAVVRADRRDMMTLLPPLEVLHGPMSTSLCLPGSRS